MIGRVTLGIHKWKKRTIELLNGYRREAEFVWELIKPLKNKVYVIGTPEHTNIGDSAIVIAEMEFLRKCGFNHSSIKEITFKEYSSKRKLIKKVINKRCLICLHGGGNMGNQWIEEEYFRRQVITDLRKCRIIVFPQTIYYSDTDCGKKEKELSKLYYNSPNITIIAREKQSFELMQEIYKQADLLLMPDIVLSSDILRYSNNKQKRKDILLCLRNDVERALTIKEEMKIYEIVEQFFGTYKKTDMYSAWEIDKVNRLDIVTEKLREFMSAKLVITDRLHGMIFSTITETPCIVLGNYNHKVSGTYEWISGLPYIQLVDSVEDISVAIESLRKLEKTQYRNQDWIQLYDSLKERICKYVIN